MKRHFPALFGLLVCVAASAETTPTKFGTLAIGSVVPEFKVVGADGGDITVSPQNNRVTVVSVMATNRSPGDALETAFSKYRAQDVTVIGVCAGATREEFEAWRAKNKSVSYPL